MKISEIPTDWVMIEATTNSEWDSCNCAVAYIGGNFKEKIEKLADQVVKIREEFPDTYNICLWDSVTFLNLGEGNYAEYLEAIDEEGFIFIEIENEKELELLNTPEQRIDTQQLCIDVYKTFMWKGYGKHTGEEFWTNSILIDKFLEQWQTSVKSMLK